MGDAQRQAAIENPGMLDHMLETCRAFYEREDYDKGAIYAVALCLQFGLPIPEWLEGEVAAAMRFYRDNKPAAARGAKRLPAKTRDARRDALRYQYVERERAKGATKEEALDRALLALRGTFGRGAIKTIEESYDKLDQRYRKGPRKPGPKRRKPNPPLA